jgi:hypothetical protein
MRTRLLVCLFAITVLFSLSTVDANRLSKSGSRPSLSKDDSSQASDIVISNTYRSRNHLHKAAIPNDNQQAIELARASGAREIADYGSYKLFALDEQALDDTQRAVEQRGSNNFSIASRADERSSAATVEGLGIAVRDDLNVLLLRSGAIDTTDEETTGSFIGMGRSAASFGIQSLTSRQNSAGSRSSGKNFRLIQFVGPVKRAWLDQLESSGFELIAYVPNNGYLVRGDDNARARLMSINQSAEGRGEGFLQWDGPFLDEHKMHPAVARAMSGATGEMSIAIQLALGKSEQNSRENAEVKLAKKLASKVLVDSYAVLNFTNLRLRIDASRLADLVALPSIVNIEPWTTPRLFDERANQIVAGSLTTDRAGPTGPGYVAWLAAHGFTSNFNFAIDVTDSGLDRGVTTPDKLHPDFLDANKQSRVLYARDYTSELDPGDIPGHGTLNASIAAGASTSADKGMRDPSGYNYGLGIAPFAMLGSSKIFQASGDFDLIDPFTKVIAEAYRDGARVLSNSWGAGTNAYTIDAQEYDLRARDAVPDQAGNQEAVICFASGNSGNLRFIGDPSTAKNVISVAAGEGSRKDGVDGCNVKDTDADNAMDIAFFSSGGPTNDGRIKPDITAPGTHIQGAASQNPDFDSTGVCGPASVELFFPQGQTLYTWSSGTSHSTPQVAGAAALARQFLINRSETPNAALIKALLLNTTTYMTGALAGGDLPHPRQGWGLMNMNRAFDNTPKIFVNQTNTFTDTGQDFVLTGEVKDSSQPFRVTLAWTDAPGFSGAAPWVNDLDLEVTINGQVYRGNNFVGQDSQPGGSADHKNNVEGVWLPAGVTGSFVVRVVAANIAGDGVPSNNDLSDQDFALVVYNGEKKDLPVATLASVALSGGSDSVADPGESVSMKLSISDVSPIALPGGHGTITTTTTGVTITGAAVDFPNLAPGQSAESTSPFTFTLASSVACGSSISFIAEITSPGAVSRLPFTVRVGQSQTVELFADNVEAGESKWTHGSGIKKKKLRLDTWVIANKRVHGGANSWFTPDIGSQIIDDHLDTLPIQLPADGRNLQLVFYQTYEFERGTWDGGVLEISSGGDFEDLGPKILQGRYTGTVRDFTSNPLSGRPGWVEGRMSAFEQVVVDLSSYAGKTVTIRFRIGTDTTGKGLGWYIDDVTLRGERVICTHVE